MSRKLGIALIAALVCAVIAWLWVSGGINISPDSKEYMAAAQIRQDYGGLPVTYGVLAPMYPLVLSIFPNIELATKLLNVISFALTGFLTMLVLEPDPLAALLVMIVLALSPALQYVQGFAWSEPLFIALVALFFYGIKRDSVITMTMAVGMACMERYSGLALIPAGLFAVWQMQRKPLLPSAMFLVGASAPISMWMLRNMVQGMGLLGIRLPGTTTWGIAIGFTLSAIAVWWPFLIAAALLATRLTVSRKVALAAGVYSIFHCAMVIYGAATTNLDMPDQRLLAPAFIPILLIVIAIAHSLLKDRLLFKNARVVDPA